MKNIVLGFILLSITMSMIYTQMDNLMKERAIEDISNNTVEITINIIDLKKGHLSKKNEYCSKTGYWDDFNIDNILDCTYMTHLDIKEDTAGRKYINTKEDIRIYITVIDPKRIKLEYDFNYIEQLQVRIQNNISKKIKNYTKMKYKIIDANFSLEDKIYELTLEI